MFANKYPIAHVAEFTALTPTQITEVSHFTAAPITFRGNVYLRGRKHTNMTSRKVHPPRIFTVRMPSYTRTP